MSRVQTVIEERYMQVAPSQVLAVVCDVGPTFGVGHLMRCLALAEEFAASGTEVVFLADVESVPFALAQLESRGLAHRGLPQSPQELRHTLIEVGATGAVIDSYHLPAEMYRTARSLVPTLAFTDGDPQGRSADLWLDQNIGAESDTWPVPDGTTRLAGTEFALMRSEILASRPTAPRLTESAPLRVFAFFGGTDAFGAGRPVTQALIDTGLPFTLRVVTPTPWAEVPQVGPGQQVEMIPPTDHLAEEVLGADLVLSAAGTSSWELLCLGAACAFVCVADNQADSYARVVDAGLGLGLGKLDDLAGDAAATISVLADALTQSELRARLRVSGWGRIDGSGRTRVRAAFTALTRQ